MIDPALLPLLASLVAPVAQDVEDAPLMEVAPTITLAERTEELAQWRAHLRPASDELAFEQIDWMPDFAQGLRRADAEQKPLLLWVMNGHPLGCT